MSACGSISTSPDKRRQHRGSSALANVAPPEPALPPGGVGLAGVDPAAGHEPRKAEQAGDGRVHAGEVDVDDRHRDTADPALRPSAVIARHREAENLIAETCLTLQGGPD